MHIAYDGGVSGDNAQDVIVLRPGQTDVFALQGDEPARPVLDLRVTVDPLEQLRIVRAGGMKCPNSKNTIY